MRIVWRACATVKKITKLRNMFGSTSIYPLLVLLDIATQMPEMGLSNGVLALLDIGINEP